MTPIDPAMLAKFSIADDAWFEDPNEGVSRTIYLFNYAYQLCAAEKQVEIDALTARIATLEQRRQQDRETLDWFKSWAGDRAIYRLAGILPADYEARTKEPHHD